MNILKGFVLLIIAWVALHAAINSGLPGIGKLPGDLHFEGENWEMHIPFTTCLVVSAILFAVSFFVSKLRGV